MAVDRQVSESFLSTGDGGAADEVSCEHAVPSLPRHVIDSVYREEQATTE